MPFGMMLMGIIRSRHPDVQFALENARSGSILPMFLSFALLYGSQLQNSCDMPASGRGARERRSTSNLQLPTFNGTADGATATGARPDARRAAVDT